MLPDVSIEAACGSVSFPYLWGGRCCQMQVVKLHVAASPSPIYGGRPGWGITRRGLLRHIQNGADILRGSGNNIDRTRTQSTKNRQGFGVL